MQADAQGRAGELQAGAARDAAQANLTASREGQALTRDMYQQQLINQAPAARGGQLALSALMSGMGLGPARNSAWTQGGPSGNVGPGGMPIGAGAGPVGSFMNAAGQAVDAQGNPLTSSGMPLQNIGASDQEMIDAGSPFAGTFNEQFAPSDITMDPSYQWRLGEGSRNLRAQQAAGGNRWGGQAMKDITNYGQNAASQEYGAAYDRFQKNKSLLYDRLSGIAGIGTGAGNAASAAAGQAGSQMANLGMTGATNASNALMGGANAQAGSMVGSTNAMVGGITGGLNNGMQWYSMRNLNPSSNTSGGSTYSGPADYSMWGGGPVKLGGQP